MEMSLSCPSYLAKSGAKLFGIRGINGEVQYLKETIEIDNTFIKESKKGTQAEARFRFSGKCIESGCLQWQTENKSCGLAQKLIHTYKKSIDNQLISHCPIREKCRWFAQEQYLACVNCNEVFRNQETVILQTN